MVAFGLVRDYALVLVGRDETARGAAALLLDLAGGVYVLAGHALLFADSALVAVGRLAGLFAVPVSVFAIVCGTQSCTEP